MARNTAESEYGKLTDEELVRLAGEGNEEAEQTLILRFMPLVKMKSRPYFLIGADKEDLVQEGSIGLIGAIRDFDPSRNVSFRAYADVCIANNVLAAVKRATRKKHMPLNSSISLDKPIVDDDENTVTLGERLEQPSGGNPEELAIMHEAELNFNRALERELTPLELRVLELFLGGLSYRRIAEEIGKSVKTVDNALQRVKRKTTALMKKNTD